MQSWDIFNLLLWKVGYFHIQSTHIFFLVYIISISSNYITLDVVEHVAIKKNHR